MLCDLTDLVKQAFDLSVKVFGSNHNAGHLSSLIPFLPRHGNSFHPVTSCISSILHCPVMYCAEMSCDDFVCRLFSNASKP